jgi:hypothetical protein
VKTSLVGEGGEGNDALELPAVSTIKVTLGIAMAKPPLEFVPNTRCCPFRVLRAVFISMFASTENSA